MIENFNEFNYAPDSNTLRRLLDDLVSEGVLTAVATDKEKLFGEFLRRVEPRCPTSEERYKQLRLKLVKFFSWKGCEDAEGLSDETISRFVKNLGEREIATAITYSVVYAIAVNLYREYSRTKKKENRVYIESDEPAPSRPEDIDCRAECLQRLPREHLMLLEDYYSGQSRENVAQALGISINALRLKVHRLKAQLQSCYQDCVRKKSSGD